MKSFPAAVAGVVASKTLIPVASDESLTSTRAVAPSATEFTARVHLSAMMVIVALLFDVPCAARAATVDATKATISVLGRIEDIECSP